jgi:bile acid:Na+ symporter, BASS family
MKALISFVVPASTFILLIAVGLELTVADFARVRRQPAVLVTGLLGPIILLPPVALALIWLFRPSPEIAASLLLIAACPIGGISNTYSYLARASTALSVSLTALSCLAATVTMPAIGKAFEMALQAPLLLSAPIHLIIRQLVLVLLLPVAIGMSVRHWAPERADRHSPALRRMAFALTGVVLASIIADNVDAFVSGLATTVPLAIAFVAASLGVGWGAAALVTADRRDRFTIAAEFGTRNVAIALAIAVTLLGHIEFARFAVTYGLVEIPMLLGAVAIFRRRHALAMGRQALSA